IAGLVAIVGVAALVGWLLPVKHEASSTAHIDRPREAIFADIIDVASYPTWFNGVKRVAIADAARGPRWGKLHAAPAGTIRFREHTSTGSIGMEVVESTPPSRVVSRIADPTQ